jgi:hypothetical protein
VPGGVLVHCISGWDRTPLFVSLLRLSRWADGRAHQSLSPAEILDLTVAYDWLLFGHLLSNRLGRGEEIFRFCFDFLQYMAGEDFVFAAATPPAAQPAAGAGPVAIPVPPPPLCGALSPPSCLLPNWVCNKMLRCCLWLSALADRTNSQIPKPGPRGPRTQFCQTRRARGRI